MLLLCEKHVTFFYTQVITIKIAWLGLYKCCCYWNHCHYHHHCLSAASAVEQRKVIFWHGYIYFFMCFADYSLLTAVVLALVRKKQESTSCARLSFEILCRRYTVKNKNLFFDVLYFSLLLWKNSALQFFTVQVKWE